MARLEVICDILDNAHKLDMRQRRNLGRMARYADNAFAMTDDEFRKNYRINKELFEVIYKDLEPLMPQPTRRSDIPRKYKVLVALSFYATGSYQRLVGGTQGTMMSQQSVSRAIREVTNALNSNNILNKWLKFPPTRRQRDLIKQRFYEKFKIPAVTGCIDGTHVAIVRPSENEERFYNRKGYHSRNILIICDADLNILSVDASFGGASHDTFVWNQHPVKNHLINLINAGERVFLLAEMAHESGGGADGSPQHTPSPPHAPRVPLTDTSFHQQIMQNQNPRKNHIAERAKQTLESSFLLQLKKQQQLQQEILLQHFQQQRQQLAQEHEQQLMHHLKLWEQQKAMEEAARREAREALEAREARDRERHERDRVELMRKKDKHEHSANASTEVKQKLQQFLKKKQASANGTVPGSSYRNWGIVKSSSGESITSTGATATHPYRLAAPLPLALNAAPPQASPDYPLRKTASEPNMLKVRLKARVIERRASPLARPPFKTRVKHRNCDGSSPRGSPPGGAGAGASAPIREEEEGMGRAAELLFSSPSMPNISLGRPHQPPPMPPVPHPHPPVVSSLPPVSEAPGWPLPHARLCKRPLGRTHSAPLPLGDPALTPPTAHHYLRDQIRKTVLTRAHDAAAAQLREEEGEVIDLTSRRAPASLAPCSPAAAPPAPAAPAAACEPAPLARALSSPLVGARTPATGLAYDALMLKHGCACGAHAPTHPEHGGRLQSVWARLCETGLVARAERTRPRKATFEELQSVHSEAHVAHYGGRAREGAGVRLVRLACGGLGVDSDTAWSDAHTPGAARAAAGAVLDLAVRTAKGELRNGFAVVRPPGHHAEPNQAMGFCFFNSVAVAARLLHTRHRLQRILIVDWDVHHGNGTQQIFYSDPHVLYMSIHRHDDGNFFPGTGAASEAGAGPGLGYTVNVAWCQGTNPPLADAEYLAAFRSVIMPIAKEYDPEIVLVSCGFDAAAGHPAPLGGYSVSAACFAHMTRELSQLAGGKLVLALEGGYDLPAMCDCAQECVRALLGDKAAAPALAELARPPHARAQEALRATLAVHSAHWRGLRRSAELLALSALDAAPAVAALRLGRLQTERDAADTCQAMATLSMQQAQPEPPGTERPAHRSAESSRSTSEEPMEQDEGK